VFSVRSALGDSSVLVYPALQIIICMGDVWRACLYIRKG